MATFSKTVQFNASAQKVWDVVQSFSDIANWLPPVQTCESTGDGVGSVRTLTLPDGGKVVEHLDAHDAAGRTYTYTIQESPFPMSSYTATMTVKDAGAGSEVVWACEFEPSGASEDDVRGILAGVYDAGFAGIESALG